MRIVDLPPTGRSDKGIAVRNALEQKRNSGRGRGREPAGTMPVDPSQRRMIAWDGEGMKLSGDKNPQHYVLFGCSADVQNPLIISDPKGDLTFPQLVDYACNIADRFPNAFHVGYFFSYDQNMIIKALPPMQKLRLYEKGNARMIVDKVSYRVQWTPGKRIRLTRILENGTRSSLVIDDMAAFFAQSFVKAYKGLFPEDDGSDAFRRVVEGKANRAVMMFTDLSTVLEYWQDEIVLLEKMAERFRTIMYDAGFMLREWYGPGALANLIRRLHGLALHEYGGKQENLPTAVHDASKRAYFGGRFEQFQAGRVKGPIYALDINSAYPSALRCLHSMRKGGRWVYATKPTTDDSVRIGVYRIEWSSPSKDALEWLPQPLPHRDEEANISFPPLVKGWYWTPEARLIYGLKGAKIVECWEWHPVSTDEWPWDFLLGMYEQRSRLKAAGNPMERAFKLGPNSLYGKLAQRAGWDEDKRVPPSSHTLPLAGIITSFCRAELFRTIEQLNPNSLVAVETDGIFTTQNPDTIKLTTGKGLGEWGVTVYDEMIYVQSGLYLYRQGDVWNAKTRGMNAESITYERVTDYLRTLEPGTKWEGTEIQQSERFIGLGSAISRSRTREGTGSINPFKLTTIHCRWEASPKVMVPGLKGKRIHVSALCPACSRNESPADSAHRLVVRSRALKNPESFPYLLPWETGFSKAQWQILDEVSNHEIGVT